MRISVQPARIERTIPLPPFQFALTQRFAHPILLPLFVAILSFIITVSATNSASRQPNLPDFQIQRSDPAWNHAPFGLAGDGSPGLSWPAAQRPVEIVFALGEEDQNKAITVGDPFSLVLEITHPAGTQVEIPGLPAAWGAFEVRTQPPAQTETLPDGRLHTRQEITAALFAPGEHTTPTLSIAVVTASKTVGYPVPRLVVMVQSVLEDGDTALRDIRPQAEMDAPFRWGWLALLALAGLAAWGLLRRWTARVEPAAPPSPPSVHETALAELDRIQALSLPDQKRFKEHYSLLDTCLRRYLEAAWGLPALERTTAEITRALEALSRPPENIIGLLALLQASDRVKFACHTPSIQEASAHLLAARLWVERNSHFAREDPRPEPPPPDSREDPRPEPPSPDAREGLRPEPLQQEDT